MPRRKRDVVRPPLCKQASIVPPPLQELYNRASLFLDKQSTHQDHYWAVGIHKAIHASFPKCWETHTAATRLPGRSSTCQVSQQITETHRKEESRSTIRHRASKGKRRRKSGPEQLAFKLVHEDLPDCRGSHEEGDHVRFRRFQRAVSMEVGQRVVLVCTIWSTRNQTTIESGTWGEISEVTSSIKVEWQLPYFQTPLWDSFPPDEYISYFEEELEMNSFSL
jgi:hypothetical protein